MRYYLTDGSGGYVGPFEADAVRGKFQAGEITADSLACPEGGQEWLPLTSFPELGAVAAPAPPPMTGAPPMMGAQFGAPPPYVAGSDVPKLSYVAPVLAALFCCQIGGIIAIIYTATGNTAAVQGNFEQYEKHKSARNGWLIASVAIGVIVTLGWIFMVIAAEAGGY
ncbi:MAG: DUF4339 domain-containing protein [Planctomycetes bacterium]|nr:DUF4339 domain-containing protein [Planctomycetota bacterium]